MKKIVTLLLIAVLTPLLIGSSRYNYSFYGDVVYSAPGMNYRTFINLSRINVGGNAITAPEDLVIYDQKIYVISSGYTTDTGQTSQNGVIAVLDEQFNLEQSIVSFEFDDSYSGDLNTAQPLTLLSPTGLDVRESGIYIADTGNKRIVKLNHDFKVLNVFNKIEDPTFKQPDVDDTLEEDKIDFMPTKITADSSGRMYVIARNAFEGIIELESSGSFNRFTGVNPVQLTPGEVIKRWFMTEEQLDKLPRFLPTEYTNIVMDERNFMYATASAASDTGDTAATSSNQRMIQLINPKGVDVLTRTRSYFIPQGDVQFVTSVDNYVVEGPSQLVDIAITDHGIYSVLDTKHARIFTYDADGNLLYINGEEGTQSDKLSTNIVSLGYLNDELLVLDKQSRELLVFELSAFGRAVNNAVALYEAGDFMGARDAWEEVIKLNTNYEIAYNGIGKYYLRTGQYKQAVEYFKLGHDHYYYSKAFKAYRNEIIKDNFGWIVGAIFALSAGLITVNIIKKNKKGAS